MKNAAVAKRYIHALNRLKDVPTAKQWPPKGTPRVEPSIVMRATVRAAESGDWKRSAARFIGPARNPAEQEGYRPDNASRAHRESIRSDLEEETS